MQLVVALLAVIAYVQQQLDTSGSSLAAATTVATEPCEPPQEFRILPLTGAESVTSQTTAP